MRVVIVGGNECMVCQYKEICQQYGCKPKIFVKESGNLKKQIGTPDLMVLFTNTVSHKMINSTIMEAKRCNAQIVRIHSSSATALADTLENYNAVGA